jgi:chorismate dehydratase
VPPDLDRMLADTDAALLIGDPALFTDADALGLTKIDLGSTWREMTGLPFVWAFWAGRLDAAPPDVCRALAEARDRGVLAIDRIAADYAPHDPARAAKVARYLKESIAYDLEGPFESGLRRYYALLAQYGLLDAHPEARFFGD